MAVKISKKVRERLEKMGFDFVEFVNTFERECLNEWDEQITESIYLWQDKADVIEIEVNLEVRNEVVKLPNRYFKIDKNGQLQKKI